MLTSSFFGARIGSSPAFVAARPVHRGVAHVQTPQPVVPLTIEAAHKKGSGSTKNGRDSVSKRRGVKVYGGQPVPAGGIIIRQLGTKVHPGRNVGLGKDYTLFALIDGVVKFERNSRIHKVSVVPFEDYVVPEGQRMVEGSRKHRRRQASMAALAAEVEAAAQA